MSKNSQNQSQKEQIEVLKTKDTYQGFFSAEKTAPTSQSEATREKKDERYTGNLKWFPHFKASDNLFPQVVAWHQLNSPTNRAILASKKAISKGKLAFTLKDEEVEYDKLSQKDRDFFDNPSGEVLYNIHDLWFDMISNWITFGEITPYFKRTRSGKAEAWTVSIFDQTKPRLLKDGKRIIVSAYWDDIKNNTSHSYVGEADKYDVWDLRGKAPDEFVFRKLRKEPGYDRYGVPDYWSCHRDAFNEYLIDVFNKNQLEDGFFPRSFITYIKSSFSNGEDPQSFLEAQYDKMKGAYKAGKTRLSVVSDKDAAPLIHEFDSSKEGEFLNLEESSKKGIITAHRWFPSLAGMETAGKLGNNQELVNQYNIALNTVAKPDYQTPMLRVLNKMLEIVGVDARVKVINEPPISDEDTIDRENVLTLNELRDRVGEAPDPDEEKGSKYLWELTSKSNTKDSSDGGN